MARKSSKTSHVLHLLSQDKETQPEKSKVEVPTIAIIDQTESESDPVAQAIHQQLLEEEGLVQMELEEEPVIEDTLTPTSTPQVEEVMDENKFVTLNILHELAQLKLSSFMEQFRMCQCERCQKDTLALALNHLPVKHKVVEKDHITPILDVYSKQYEAELAVAMTKACIVVKVHPNH